jgi:hypothetical protein
MSKTKKNHFCLGKFKLVYTKSKESSQNLPSNGSAKFKKHCLKNKVSSLNFRHFYALKYQPLACE